MLARWALALLLLALPAQAVVVVNGTGTGEEPPAGLTVVQKVSAEQTAPTPATLTLNTVANGSLLVVSAAQGSTVSAGAATITTTAGTTSSWTEQCGFADGTGAKIFIWTATHSVASETVTVRVNSGDTDDYGIMGTLYEVSSGTPDTMAKVESISTPQVAIAAASGALLFGVVGDWQPGTRPSTLTTSPALTLDKSANEGGNWGMDTFHTTSTVTAATHTIGDTAPTNQLGSICALEIIP